MALAPHRRWFLSAAAPAQNAYRRRSKMRASNLAGLQASGLELNEEQAFAGAEWYRAAASLCSLSGHWPLIRRLPSRVVSIPPRCQHRPGRRLGACQHQAVHAACACFFLQTQAWRRKVGSCCRHHCCCMEKAHFAACGHPRLVQACSLLCCTQVQAAHRGRKPLLPLPSPPLLLRNCVAAAWLRA